jgi:2-iminobutanoate/2-iminopropanoate deaminase
MTGSREAIDAPTAPTASGPYSHAITAGELLFCSGQLPLDPASGEVVGGGAAAQAERCLLNLEAVCSAAGTALSRAARLTVYLSNPAELTNVNVVYERFFDRAPPARTSVLVAALPRDAEVEIDAVVAL